MRNILKISLFAMTTVLSSNAFAATGAGHAQTELSTPLIVANQTDVHFGTIAIDPAAGAQTVDLEWGGTTCPAVYVCSAGATLGIIRIDGQADSSVNISITGATATLSDGTGNTVTFDPSIVRWSSPYNGLGTPVNADTLVETLNPYLALSIGGSITFTGSEIAGTYSSQNGGGLGYTVTVNY